MLNNHNQTLTLSFDACITVTTKHMPAGYHSLHFTLMKGIEF